MSLKTCTLVFFKVIVVAFNKLLDTHIESVLWRRNSFFLAHVNCLKMCFERLNFISVGLSVTPENTHGRSWDRWQQVEASSSVTD